MARLRLAVFSLLVFLGSADAVSGAPKAKQPLTLEGIFLQGVFTDGKAPRALQWLPTQNALVYGAKTASGATEFKRLSAADKKQSVWIAADELLQDGKPIATDFVLVSPLEDKVLFTGLLPARAAKGGGAFYLFDLKTRKLSALEGKGRRLPQFSPDGTKLAFVQGSELVVHDLATGKEEALTRDGGPHVFNGSPDWSYEEEFRLISAWKWAPDSQSIAYWQMDERKVPTHPLVDYDAAHPSIRSMRYPKAGDPLPKVRIGIVSLRTLRTDWVDFSKQGEHYIPRIDWSPHGELYVQVLNRRQNRLELFAVDAATGAARSLIVETSEGWVDIYDDLRFLKDGGFLWSSRKSGFKHVYRYDAQGAPVVRLTRGEGEVIALAAVDEAKSKVYFTAGFAGPREKQLYVVDLDGRNQKSVSREAGAHAVSFSKDAGYYFELHSSADVPASLRLRTAAGKAVVGIHPGTAKTVAQYAIGKTEFFVVPTESKIELPALRLVPENFDAHKKYPVLMYAYGGPGSQKVLDEWGGSTRLFHSYLLQKGYVVVIVDGRGTGAQGKAFEQQVFRRLGKVESEDQLEAARWLAKQDWVDGTRIGLWGWSYGGYLAALTAGQAKKTLKVAMSVAPVTHWQYYDAPYTERFMSTPKDNPKGYEESAPTHFAAGLDAKFLLIHGTGDDNVHFQNSVALVDKLIAAGKSPDVMIYPYGMHSLAESKNMRMDVFRRLAAFVEKNL